MSLGLPKLVILESDNKLPINTINKFYFICIKMNNKFCIDQYKKGVKNNLLSLENWADKREFLILTIAKITMLFHYKKGIRVMRVKNITD